MHHPELFRLQVIKAERKSAVRGGLSENAREKRKEKNVMQGKRKRKKKREKECGRSMYESGTETNLFKSQGAYHCKIGFS